MFDGASRPVRREDRAVFSAPEKKDPPLTSELKRLLPILVLLSAFSIEDATGDVVVIANRTADEVSFTISTPAKQEQEFTIAAGDVVAIPIHSRLGIRFSARNQPVYFDLKRNSAYLFLQGSNGALELHGVKLPGEEPASNARQSEPNKRFDNTKVIPVKILVDEEERGSREFWEERLRKRLTMASDILERYCRIRFEVVATGTWQSDNERTDLHDIMREFEAEVDPGPAVLAIGFTGQQTELMKGMHIAGSRGPLRPHVLLFEWLPGISEVERLEMLVHELGHYLGAAHSLAPDSVMRPLLADRRARWREFRIKPDLLNTLAMCLVADEIRSRNVTKLSDLSSATRQRLRQVYAALAKAFPEDSAAREIDRVVEITLIGPLAAGTRHVVRSVVRAAEGGDDSGAKPATGRATRPQGDELTNFYIQRAAQAASELPEETRHLAFLLGIGIALDDSDFLPENPLTRKLCQSVESSRERQQRLAVLGNPTMLGRHDLAQHFVVSAFLTAHSGSLLADAAGVAKEYLDAQGGSGFSFADLAADQAGISFARLVVARKLGVKELGLGFATADYMPTIEGLPEDLSAATFRKEYARDSGRRFHELRAEIRARVQSLAPYRSE